MFRVEREHISGCRFDAFASADFRVPNAERVEQSPNGHPFHVFLFITREVDVWNEKFVRRVERGGEFFEEFAGSRMLVRLERYEERLVGILRLQRFERGADFRGVMAVIGNNEVAVLGCSNDFAAPPGSAVLFQCRGDGFFGNSRKEERHVREPRVLREVFARNGEFHFGNLFQNAVGPHVSVFAYEIRIQVGGFRRSGDLARIFAIRRKHRGLLGFRKEFFERRKVIRKVFVVVEVVEVDIGDYRDFGFVPEERPAVFARFDDERGIFRVEMTVFSVELGNLGSNHRRTSESGFDERRSDHGGSGRFSVASGDGDSGFSVEKFRERLGIRKPADFPFVRFADFRVRKHLLFLGKVGFRYDGFGIYEKRRIFRKVFFGVPNENPHAFAFERTGYVGFRTVGSGNRPSGLQIIPGHGGHADSADAHHV